MMSEPNVPDAWDDDWTKAADKSQTPAAKATPAKLSKAERRAQHAALQREIWGAAENPEPAPIFLTAKDNTPLQSGFQPALKLLSRKPPVPLLAKKDTSAQLAGTAVEDEEDSEEEERKRQAASLAERQAQAVRDREEKQRRYEERRRELLGDTETKQQPSSRPLPQNRQRARGNTRGRGGYRSADSNSSSANQSPARSQTARPGQLYEPAYSVNPGSTYIQRRDDPERSRPGTPKDQQQPIREPRNPDSSGRGGFGFAPRGRGGNAP